MFKNIDYFLVVCIVMLGAQANIITIHNATLVLCFSFTLYIYVKRGYKIDKKFLIFILIYLFISFLYYFKFGWIDIFRVFREIIRFTYGYIIFKMLNKKFISYFEDIVYKLALISIPFYILQLIDFNFAKQIVGIIEHNIPMLDYRDNWYENIFIFTINDRYMGLGEGAWRNSGFAWEPKGFASILSLAIFFNLIKYKFKLNKRFYIMSIVLLTTFSTAGYLVYLITIIPFLIYNKYSKLKYIFLPFAILIIGLIFLNTERLKDKIVNEIYTSDKLLGYQYDRNFKGESRSMGRFGSLLLDYYDFKKEPLIGYGVQKSERTMESIGGVKLVRVNGFSDLLAKYGILGLLFWIVSLFLSSYYLSIYYKFKGSYFIVLAILMISFGSAIVVKPILIIFPFIWFSLKKIIKKYTDPPEQLHSV